MFIVRPSSLVWDTGNVGPVFTETGKKWFEEVWVIKNLVMNKLCFGGLLTHNVEKGPGGCWISPKFQGSGSNYRWQFGADFQATGWKRLPKLIKSVHAGKEVWIPKVPCASSIGQFGLVCIFVFYCHSNKLPETSGLNVTNLLCDNSGGKRSKWIPLDKIKVSARLASIQRLLGEALSAFSSF